jgi:DNA-binding beta-propeller fold protein YncE
VVYVSDSINDTVQKFTDLGGLIFQFAGPFQSPGHIAIDAANEWVYIADKDNRRVLKYDSFGRFLAELGAP